MDRIKKEALVERIKEIFSTSMAAIVIDYKGLEANETVTLRKELQKVPSKIKVVKNTLAKIAVQGTPFEEISNEFVHTRALVFTESDPVGQAKAITEFAKKNEKLKIASGILVTGGKVSMLDAAQLEALAKLPSKEELISKLLFLLNAPITQLVRTIHEVPASFVRTLSAITESKQ